MSCAWEGWGNSGTQHVETKAREWGDPQSNKQIDNSAKWWLVQCWPSGYKWTMSRVGWTALQRKNEKQTKNALKTQSSPRLTRVSHLHRQLKPSFRKPSLVSPKCGSSPCSLLHTALQLLSHTKPPCLAPQQPESLTPFSNPLLLAALPHPKVYSRALCTEMWTTGKLEVKAAGEPEPWRGCDVCPSSWRHTNLLYQLSSLGHGQEKRWSR